MTTPMISTSSVRVSNRMARCLRLLLSGRSSTVVGSMPCTRLSTTSSAMRAATARELERAVRRTLRAKDWAALAEIYRKLCRSELPISPSVARILRLIDRVGTAQAPSSVAPEAPGLPS